MNYTKQQFWDRFKRFYPEFPELGLAMDLSRMNFGDDFLPKMEPPIQKAFADMAALEKGAIANPDENRMVGHYWLRNPDLAPTPEITRAGTPGSGLMQEETRTCNRQFLRFFDFASAIQSTT